jgi:hypothetical protein
MNTWLKLIGSGKYPITGWKENYVGFRKEKKPGIRKGDHLVLYAPGGSKRIFALAEATSDPERDINYDAQKEGSCRWKLGVQYSINLSVSSGVHIDEVSTGQRHLTDSIQRASHIKLFPEEYRLASSKLQQKTAT